ncbi:MAG: DNA mismatch repair endonuclease MutL [Chthonomonas sp.]|nr:DNA mismatch repair endonuclease MutL [Chthonomonas sp.]
MSTPVETPRARVRLLDAHTINQIAAGEVVDRPASALKELVENALDAGATRIEVELDRSGIERLLVRDNGCGMDADDLTTALQRHATSKIQRIEDLSRTASLGFRGEALPSIASVSRMRVTTGTGDGIRYELVVDGGVIEPIRTVSGPQGTEVVVEDLFFNTPARLKFLKSDTTELNACVDVVQRLAVVRPDVRFTIRSGKTVVLQSAGDDDLLGALAEVWGRDAARALAELDHFEEGVRVRGFISPPHFTKGTRAFQWLFVNGRPIRSRALQVAVDLAYRVLTPEKRFPLTALIIDVDPARVDMNVSPTKSEVKFQHEVSVNDAVRHAVKQALLHHGMIPDAAGLMRVNQALDELSAPPWHATLSQAQASIDAQQPLFAPGEGPQLLTTPVPPNAYCSLLEDLRVIGQSMNTFIIAENCEGLLVIDQHVAHERILYEMLVRQRGSGMVEQQPLLVPVTVTLDRRSTGALLDQTDTLRALGFEISEFGDDAILVRAVPAALRVAPEQVLREIADEMMEGMGGCVSPARQDLWVTASCKMAVKAGDPLSFAEMEKLIIDLAQTENPYLCPHGRPITIVMGKGELLRKFKRT